MPTDLENNTLANIAIANTAKSNIYTIFKSHRKIEIDCSDLNGKREREKIKKAIYLNEYFS